MRGREPRGGAVRRGGSTSGTLIDDDGATLCVRLPIVRATWIETTGRVTQMSSFIAHDYPSDDTSVFTFQNIATIVSSWNASLKPVSFIIIQTNVYPRTQEEWITIMDRRKKIYKANCFTIHKKWINIKYGCCEWNNSFQTNKWTERNFSGGHKHETRASARLWDLSIVATCHEIGWKITPFPRARLRFNQVWFRILEFVYRTAE